MFPSALSTIFQGLFWLSIAIAVVLGSTWIITSVRFHTQVQRLRTAKAEDEKTEPPTLPYSIPWLGSAVGFLVEQGSFWANMRYVGRYNRPIYLYKCRRAHCLPPRNPVHHLHHCHHLLHWLIVLFGLILRSDITLVSISSSAQSAWDRPAAIFSLARKISNRSSRCPAIFPPTNWSGRS